MFIGNEIGTAPDQYPDEIARGLDLTNKAIQESSQRDKFASPDKVAKIIQDSAAALERARNDDPTYRAANEPERPKRKRKVKEGERGWIESDFQKVFRQWALANGSSSAAFECKSTPDDSIPFDRLEPHQKDYLLRSKHQKSYYHPSDYANSLGIRQKLPCDGIMLVGVKAFVPVMFRVREKGNRDFYLIGIDEWVKEEASSDRKSLTEDRAGQIGTRHTL